MNRSIRSDMAAKGLTNSQSIKVVRGFYFRIKTFLGLFIQLKLPIKWRDNASHNEVNVCNPPLPMITVEGNLSERILFDNNKADRSSRWSLFHSGENT